MFWNKKLETSRKKMMKLKGIMKKLVRKIKGFEF